MGELLPETSDEKKGLMPVFYRKFIKPFNVPTINSYAVHIASVIKHITNNFINLFEGNDTERVSNLNIKDEIVLKDIIK